jgi:hypothetical protein
MPPPYGPDFGVAGPRDTFGQPDANNRGYGSVGGAPGPTLPITLNDQDLFLEDFVGPQINKEKFVRVAIGRVDSLTDLWSRGELVTHYGQVAQNLPWDRPFPLLDVNGVPTASDAPHPLGDTCFLDPGFSCVYTPMIILETWWGGAPLTFADLADFECLYTVISNTPQNPGFGDDPCLILGINAAVADNWTPLNIGAPFGFWIMGGNDFVPDRYGTAVIDLSIRETATGIVQATARYTVAVLRP